MCDVLIIEGHDYSRYIENKGVSWERNDLDSNKSGRSSLNGEMFRGKIGQKIKLTYTMFNIPVELLAQLDEDLTADFVSVKYLDLHGTKTKTFYCSSFRATTNIVYSDGSSDWGDASFSLIEK